jgi:osmotically-inducible protein OsmY
MTQETDHRKRNNKNDEHIKIKELMNNDQKLQYDVEQVLKWEPLLVGAQIGVIAQDGIVILTGSVDSYAKKREVEHATKTVRGVKVVIEKIEVTFASNGKKSNSYLANEVLIVVNSNPVIPENKIQVQIANGWVTIERMVKWNTQKLAVLSCIEHISGIRAIANNMLIKSDTADKIEKLGIKNALIRNWAVKEKNSKIDVFGNSVTPTGMVYSIYKKDEAKQTAWSTPGVWNFKNNLCITDLLSQLT